MAVPARTRPKVGVGVLIVSSRHPGCVLLGKRVNSVGSGTYALPGGHLEFGESWAQCATREVQEECTITVTNVRLGTVINVVDEATNFHDVVVFMVADAPPDAEPVNAEPHKCEGWHWTPWTDQFPSPVFAPLEKLRAIGFDPLLHPGTLVPGSGDGSGAEAQPSKRQRTAGSDDAVVEAAAAGLRALCDAAGIDDSHGVAHARAVLAHTEAALGAAPALAPARALAVRLAALLHDADDAKYFAATAKTYANAARLMSEVGAPTGVAADALRMISLVSCSQNGNSCPPDARVAPELLWPRWADRLEATGAVGVVRCHQYNAKVGAPFSCAESPAPRGEAEALDLATEERFAAYQAGGGGSKSMIDHYYDKLLQVARPPPELVRNAYLEAEARERAGPLLSVCLAFGDGGEPAAKARIDALAAELKR